MYISKLQIKSQRLWVTLIIFGIIWGLDLQATLRNGPGLKGFTVKESYGSHTIATLRNALVEKEGPVAREIDLGQAFINAYEANDETKMKSLVRENKSSASKELVSMINYATSGEVKPDEMTYLIKITSKMAALYHAEFSDNRLEDFVAHYKKWSRNEQEKKKEADTLFYSYKREMKNKNYDAVVEKWDRSLDMYREIGDKLGEAKRLDEIGITFGKLGSFKTSIKFLNDARGINNEIGNIWGEVTDLRYIAAGYVALEDYNNAIETYKSALNIVHDLGDKAQKEVILNDIAGIEGKMKKMAVEIE